jgi:glycosyltransferase involved in cell wall biosynthesis
MKIVRIIARLNVGGPARHVVFLTEALQDQEFQTKLIAGRVPDGEEDMSFFAAEHGIEPYYIPEMSREISPKDIVSVMKIFGQIRREKPDIIHTHTAKAGTLGRSAAFLYRWLSWGTLIGRPRRIKVVHTFHGHVFHSYYGRAKTALFLAIEKLLARLATERIVVISPKQFEEISGDFRVAPIEKFKLIPLGIDLNDFDSAENLRECFRKDVGMPPNGLLVTFVGRLTEIKNIPLLLDAIALYKAVDGKKPDLGFVIVGDGHQRSELEARAAALQILDLVTFIGNRRDAPRFYAGSDIVVLTSLNEGTPLSLIEAMAAGRPVISTGVGGVVDLLGKAKEEKDGYSVCERGIRVDSFDPKDLMKGLIYLAENEKVRLELVANGRRYVKSNYSRERLVEDIKSLYRELIAR